MTYTEVEVGVVEVVVEDVLALFVAVAVALRQTAPFVAEYRARLVGPFQFFVEFLASHQLGLKFNGEFSSKMV